VLQVVIRGNASGLIAAAHAGGHGLQGLNAQVLATGSGLQQMSGNTSVAANGFHLLGIAANTAAHHANNFAHSASASLRTVGRASRDAAQMVVNKWAALGAGVSVGFAATRGAAMDRTLMRIKRTAGASKEQADQLRKDLYQMSVQTGTPVEELVSGFGTLIQSGQSWKSSTEEIGAINKAVALTGADANALAKSLAVAGEAFKFDLSQPGKALEILDKMLIAGDLGNAEIENLSAIFAKIGGNAKEAGLSMEQTLALTEAMSAKQMDPDLLGTLVDSTLRMFTNGQYVKEAQKASKVPFFTKDGARRNPLEILQDMQKAYKKLRTEKERFLFVEKTMGKADQDTKKGYRALLDDGALAKINEFETKISNATGSISKALPEGLSNAASQTERLRESLKKIGDDVARPINDLITKYGKIVADHQDLLKNVAIGAAALLSVAVAITAAAKAIEVWRTVRSVFGGTYGTGGAGGAPGGLGGLGGMGRGSTPANPLFVYVVNGNGGASPGGLPDGIPGGGLPTGTTPGGGEILKTAWKYATSRVGLALIGGAYAAWDEGGNVEYTTKRVIAQQIGAQIGSIWGKPGEVIGQIAGDQFMKLFNDHDRAASGDATKAAEAELAKIDVGKNYSGVRAAPSDHAIAPPIQLNLYNNIDASGRVEARLEGAGPGVVAICSSLGPKWTVPR